MPKLTFGEKLKNEAFSKKLYFSTQSQTSS
jgi:hypothetical protein